MTFHPRFNRANKEHRARNEKEVKEEAARQRKPTAPFYVGQDLRVVDRDANTILVAYLDGKMENLALMRLAASASLAGGNRISRRERLFASWMTMSVHSVRVRTLGRRIVPCWSPRASSRRRSSGSAVPVDQLSPAMS